MTQGIWYRDSETDEWEVHHQGKRYGAVENTIDEFELRSIPALVELLRSQTLWSYEAIGKLTEQKLQELDAQDKLR